MFYGNDLGFKKQCDWKVDSLCSDYKFPALKRSESSNESSVNVKRSETEVREFSRLLRPKHCDTICALFLQRKA